MKKMAIAGLLAAALSLTALSQQKAAAWCGSGCWNFNAGLNFTCSGSWNCNPCCNQCCPPGFCWGCPSYGCPSYGGDPGSYASAYQAPAYQAPAYAAPQAPPAAAPAVQNAGYFYPAQYGYGSYQVPSYWYGR